ncbi:hypothetical protein BST61_g5565 [Cercospora zeina]
MPMTWDNEAQAKLYAIILQVCDVKPTEAQKVEIASRMGPGCTAKAITHKIAAIRKAGASGGGAANNIAPLSAPAKVTKKKATPRQMARAVAVKKGFSSPGVKFEDDDEEEEEEEEEEKGFVGMTTPPPSTAKNLKRKLQGVDVDESFYKDGIDVAVGEDIGQGFRKRRVSEEESEDDLL